MSQWLGTQVDAHAPRPHRLLRPGPILLLALLAGPAPVLAQTAGSIRGQVTDERGLPLEGATIGVSNAALSVTGRAALSDEEGRFQVGSLPPGADYQLAAIYPGFAGVVLTDIEVLPGQATLVRIGLQKQSDTLQERVQVKAQAPVVNLQDVTGQARFTSEFIDSLPILGRNYQDLLALAPGVSDIDGDGNPNIHGARDTDVITLVDGVSTTDPLTGKIGAQLNIESIQEIEVKTSGAPAEFSRAQGGFATIITKSGGNKFEGTFKFYWRGSSLDGDGAGIDDPTLHGGLGENDLRGTSFNDFLPFLSLSGPIVRDRAWFFLASEYVQLEEPINALSNAFVAGQREFRQFAKATWQAAPNHRLALSLNYDPQEFDSQGLNSFTEPESAYVLRQGGTVLTVKWVAVLSPFVSLETSVSDFDERPSRSPALGPDTNSNGYNWSDRNGNTFSEVKEFDPGEDFDVDGVFDVFERSTLQGGVQVPRDDDGDGRRTPEGACEGFSREDVDCDGRLDSITEDTNGNNRLDAGEDRDRDGHLDLGTEDRNGNNVLDDRPRPAAEYPYGRLQPIPPDRLYTISQQSGITSGPYYQDFTDERTRFTWRQDLGLFVPDFYGSHDMKMGLVLEREAFGRTTEGRPIVAPIFRTPSQGPSTVRAIVPAENRVHNEATAVTGGLYVQDSFKPFPNLSLGLGLRFDREATDSFGFTFFEPSEERTQFDRLNAIIGGEADVGNDLQAGNNDGIISHGIRSDPLFMGSAGVLGIEAVLGPFADPVKVAAVSRMTRHHIVTPIFSEQLQGLFPDLGTGEEVTQARLKSLGIVPQHEEAFRLTNNNLSPRLSVSWDPLSDGRTKVFATWGRYYDKLFLNTVVAEEGPDTINRYYILDPTGVDLPGIPNRQIGQSISKAPPSTTQIDRGLQTPFSDEFTFGFERELAPELALAITYVQRDYRLQLQDVDVNHALRFGSDGRPLDQLGTLPSGTLPANAVRREPDGRPDLYIYNFFFNQVLRVGNYNEATYRGMTLELVKRLSRRWELQGSYTYSRAQGQAEDFQSRLGNDPSTVESEYGYLTYDQRHVVKLNASTFLPRDWQLGVSAAWGSGLPYSIASRFFALDNVDYQQFRTRYGYTGVTNNTPTFITVSRNSLRNDATLMLGARARKNLVLGRTTAGLFIEVFNLLNTDDLHLERYEPVPPNLSDPTSDKSGPLQLDGSRQFGRRFQIGFQVSF